MAKYFLMALLILTSLFFGVYIGESTRSKPAVPGLGSVPESSGTEKAPANEVQVTKTEAENSRYTDLEVRLTKAQLELAELRTANSRLDAEWNIEKAAHQKTYNSLMETTGLATHLKRVCELYSPLPQVALVNVYVNDKPGNLNFDKDEYAAIIRSELRKNNLEVITEIAKDSPYYLIRFDISELIIENDIRSAYGIAFSVGLVDAIAGARAVYEESTFGVAGTKSDYPTTIRSALSGWIIKASDAIAQRNEINKGLLVFLRDASANELTKERNDKLLAYFNDQGRSGSPDPGPSPLPPGAPNADDKSKSSVTGTGFLISKNPLVVTNHHVILGAKKISLFKAGEGTGIPAKVLAIDEVNDLAILTTVQNSGGFTDIEPLQLGSAVGVRIGDEVTTYGYPLTGILGEGVKFSNGVINALSGPANNTALFQISVPIQPGNSGGPLLDAAGKVRGVVVSQLNARWALSQTGALPQNVNFAIKIDYVRVLLTANQLDNLLANVPGAKVNAEKAIVRIHCER